MSRALKVIHCCTYIFANFIFLFISTKHTHTFIQNTKKEIENVMGDDEEREACLVHRGEELDMNTSEHK